MACQDRWTPTTLLKGMAGDSRKALDDETVIIASQSILGQFPDAPIRLLASMEADIYPNHKPELAYRVDGAIGEGSSFHELHGYYAQGVGPEKAVLPSGWKDRLVVINNDHTNGIVGLCLEVHHLAVSKFVAGRYKDLDFIQELIRHEMIRKKIMHTRLAEAKLQDVEHSRITSKIDVMFLH